MSESPLELEGVIGFSGTRAIFNFLILTATAAAAFPANFRRALTPRRPFFIPFSGKVKHALILHPDDTHIIYPLGSTIVIKNVEDTSKQVFLQGA